jgi:hypothetical protein
MKNPEWQPEEGSIIHYVGAMGEVSGAFWSSLSEEQKYWLMTTGNIFQSAEAAHQYKQDRWEWRRLCGHPLANPAGEWFPAIVNSKLGAIKVQVNQFSGNVRDTWPAPSFLIPEDIGLAIAECDKDSIVRMIERLHGGIL